MSEEINSVKEKIFKKYNSEDLYIKRVPPDTVKLFKDYAKEKFCGDYGMCLKSIVEEMLFKPPIYIALQEQVYGLTEELELLKTKIEKGEVKKPEQKSNQKVTRVNGIRTINREKNKSKEE